MKLKLCTNLASSCVKGDKGRLPILVGNRHCLIFNKG